MARRPLWVVKLGGSLLRADAGSALRQWLAACAQPSPGPRCLVVIGGGELADAVRALQARWRFADELAHALALDTMRANARILAALSRDLAVCALSSAGAARNLRGNAIWLPPPDTAQRVRPASWRVTSDSIALWLAARVEADALCLVKSLPRSRSTASSAHALAAEGVLDADFPSRLQRSDVSVYLQTRGAARQFALARRSGRAPGRPIVA